MACETSRNKRSGGHERRKKQTLTKKKNRSDTEKKEKKIILVVAGLDLTAFLKGPEGCPLDHKYVPNRAIHTTLDHLSIHIGSTSTIQPTKMTKKRVLQRVLRYYHGSTRVG
jgi:hypothetical protein